ncbi:MAG: enoyl-CoA hydratase/isomerase family protein [Actinomycetota bacterium]|nr:MAG: enoyl-CoA hydratase/isomerase family protein [Actinomycetota bacterium]
MWVPTVKTQYRDDAIYVGLDRPEKRNALDEQMVEELHEVLDTAVRGEPKVLVLHSLVENIFVSGADISELLDRDADSAMRSINAGLFEKLERFRWPTIAAIDGYALGGGCELAMACDFRIASTRARFGQPELDLGILAGAGGNWRLPQLVGIAMARRLLYTGEIIDAEKALSVGLIDDIFAPDELMDSVQKLVDTIGRRSWRALELTKLSLGVNRQPTTTFDIIAQALLFESDDKRARMQAFLDRKGKRNK